MSFRDTPRCVNCYQYHELFRGWVAVDAVDFRIDEEEVVGFSHVRQADRVTPVRRTDGGET